MSGTVMTFIVFLPTYFFIFRFLFPLLPSHHCPHLTCFWLQMFFFYSVSTCMHEWLHLFIAFLALFIIIFLYSADVVMFSLCDRDEGSVTKRERKHLH